MTKLHLHSTKDPTKGPDLSLLTTVFRTGHFTYDPHTVRGVTVGGTYDPPFLPTLGDGMSQQGNFRPNLSHIEPRTFQFFFYGSYMWLVSYG